MQIFDIKYVEKAGLVKFDFLGLTTLSIINECVSLIKKDFKKAQCAYQNQSIRISAKKRDELQNIIQLIKNSDIDTPINFGNFRD